MPNSSYHVPVYTRIFRVILRSIFRFLFILLSRPKVYGKENIPPKGAYLIAINHVSLFEAPFILAYWPVCPEAAGAVDIWSRPGQAILARLYGGIPVHRGEYDRKLIENMLGALKSGRPLVIAPEGGRSHTPGMRRALPGAAYIINQASVPVLPVGIYGATDDFLRLALRGKRPRIEMKIGPPLLFQPIQGRGEARRLERQAIADQIMFRIAELLPPEYRGVYDSSNNLKADAKENAAQTKERNL
jgi:1-acyl-sn-glycerol-3-phosphate acyltransferase